MNELVNVEAMSYGYTASVSVPRYITALGRPSLGSIQRTGEKAESAIRIERVPGFAAYQLLTYAGERGQMPLGPQRRCTG